MAFYKQLYVFLLNTFNCKETDKLATSVSLWSVIDNLKQVAARFFFRRKRVLEIPKQVNAKTE